jgi:predicted RNA-binding Zn ribbon-like protein
VFRGPARRQRTAGPLAQTLSRADSRRGVFATGFPATSGTPWKAFVVYGWRVNFDVYARTGVELVNAPLDTLDDLKILFTGENDWMRDEVTERDMTVFRRAQKRLRDVFEFGTAGRDADVVSELNSLLEAFPVQPRISGHDSSDWHMHVTSRGASVSAEYLAGAVWGLSVWLCEYGSARFGICADARCGNVYLDTSSNNCRRFCSDRCATRSHVAAHRARKRAAVAV